MRLAQMEREIEGHLKSVPRQFDEDLQNGKDEKPTLYLQPQALHGLAGDM